jgi:hypothetical protein
LLTSFSLSPLLAMALRGLEEFSSSSAAVSLARASSRSWLRAGELVLQAAVVQIKNSAERQN